jgi:hypothetical protein
MVYNTQNYWVFGLCPSIGILETRKHNVSETGSVSVLRWGGGKISTLLGSLERADLSDWQSPRKNSNSPYPSSCSYCKLKMETNNITCSIRNRFPFIIHDGLAVVLFVAMFLVPCSGRHSLLFVIVHVMWGTLSLSHRAEPFLRSC